VLANRANQPWEKYGAHDPFSLGSATVVSVARFMLGVFGLVPVDEQKKLAVWSKGRIIHGCDPAVWRHDDFGRAIRYADFRDRSQYGWDLFPIHAGLFSDNSISNLRPLRWSSDARTPSVMSGFMKRLNRPPR
jgi:hypothetical protein